MFNQIDRNMFAKALKDLGHDPGFYRGQRISIQQAVKFYEISELQIVSAIEKKTIAAHYDYKKDTIWIDALEMAYFYFCTCSNK